MVLLRGKQNRGGMWQRRNGRSLVVIVLKLMSLVGISFSERGYGLWSRLSPVLIKLEMLFVCLSVDGKLLN